MEFHLHQQHSARAVIALAALFLILSLISGCAASVSGAQARLLSPTPSQTAAVTKRPFSTATPPLASDPPEPRLWISPAVPDGLRAQLKLPATVKIVQRRQDANLWFEVKDPTSINTVTQKVIAKAAWIYVVAVPFPTLADDADAVGLRRVWSNNFQGVGDASLPVGRQPILMTAQTRAALEALWGEADPKGVKVVDQASLLDDAWQSAPAWAILPFEDIQPRWKVLRLQGDSPLQRNFNPVTYPMTIPFTLYGSQSTAQALSAVTRLKSNYDPQKLTVLAMTGTTALSRHIGERMDAKGLTYPGQAIVGWLSQADLTHISNEVSFYQDCPKPGPDRADMRFCSNPNYIQLLEYVGTDIVELTGNHLLDWGPQPFLDTLAMYQAHGWKTYGGGANVARAQEPLLIEDHGNRLAFIGCSPSGPANVWATKDLPGSAPCDLPQMEQEIKQLLAQGYLPIVTLQAVETNTYKPAVAQAMPTFRRLAQAGAVIVSGSQSHVPQTMTFVGENFIHYGLGNLFFDQMDPVEERQEFIDQHVFYDGKYLGVILRTALLEDYSQPRPMTTAERSDFLQKIFALCDWSGN